MSEPFIPIFGDTPAPPLTCSDCGRVRDVQYVSHGTVVKNGQEWQDGGFYCRDCFQDRYPTAGFGGAERTTVCGFCGARVPTTETRLFEGITICSDCIAPR